MNRRTLGEFGDFAGKAAAVIALLIVVHAVKGKTWTQAHTYFAGTAAVLGIISQI